MDISFELTGIQVFGNSPTTGGKEKFVLDRNMLPHLACRNKGATLPITPIFVFSVDLHDMLFAGIQVGHGQYCPVH